MNQPPPPQYSQQPYQQPQQQPNPPPSRTHSGLAIGAFAVSLLAFLLGLIPFVGFFAIAGIIMAIYDLKANDASTKHGFSVAAIIFGTLATLGGFVWVLLFVLAANSKSGSCPHVYAFDGEAYRIDGDMASGALYAGAERSDWDRLEHLRAVNGVYRLRLQNDLEEVDYINRVEVLVVDHDADEELLPSQDGQLMLVKNAVSPSSMLESHDQVSTRTLTFTRPPGDEAWLIVRGHNTAFAEEAFVKYMASMGQGVGPLHAWVIDDDCPCSRSYIAEEIDRLGLPLKVTVANGETWTHAATLAPVGPAVSRSQVVPIKLPPATAGNTVTLRLTSTPNFWAIDQIQLAPASAAAVHATTVRPKAAAELLSIDGARLVLQPGEHRDIELAAPPEVDGKTRTAILSLHGYYALDIGGTAGLNVPAIIAHRAGWTSLPAFAAAR